MNTLPRVPSQHTVQQTPQGIVLGCELTCEDVHMYIRLHGWAISTNLVPEPVPLNVFNGRIKNPIGLSCEVLHHHNTGSSNS